MQGFTLIELLVVTGITVVVLSAIGACLMGGIRVWETAQNFNSAEMTARIGLSIMENDLMNAFSVHGTTFEAADDGFSFAGITGSVAEFRSDGGSKKGMGKIRYTFDVQQKALYRQEWSSDQDSGHAPDMQEMIAEDVHDVTLEYLYMPGDGERGGAWSSAKSEGTNFVRGVRVNLVIAERDQVINIERMVVLPITHKSIGGG
jgi:type II secretory pathway pseudopilin PulG